MHCTFIETPLFSETADFLSDDELRVAQIAIVANPRAGAAIRETHGARKLRVRMRSRGKSGAARIIYLDNSERCGQVWLLLAYHKTVANDLTPAGRKAVSTRRRCEGQPLSCESCNAAVQVATHDLRMHGETNEWRERVEIHTRP